MSNVEERTILAKKVPAAMSQTGNRPEPCVDSMAALSACKAMDSSGLFQDARKVEHDASC